METYSKSWSAITVLAFAALTVIVLISGVARAAGPWYVAPTGNDSNSCLSAGSPCATINGAIDKASSGDTIKVVIGTYTSTVSNEVVLINKNITLSGGWDAAFTTQNGMSTIDGEGARRGITVNNGSTAAVERFTVQMAGGDGQGIQNDGTLTLTNSLIQKNVRGVTNGGNLVINNSALINNGGLETCGGGLFTYSGSVTLNNSTVSGNSTSGIYCAPIAGIANSGGTVALNNVIVTNNINGSLWSYPADSFTIRNTLIAGNLNDYSPQDCAESERVQSLGYNLIGAAVCNITSAAGDQIGTTSAPIDPHLEPLTGSPGYHPLLIGSPAINAGNPGGCIGSTGLLTTDQRGAPRAGICDIGAYEYMVPGPAASIYTSGGTPQRTPPYSTFGTSLQAVVLDSIVTPVSNTIVAFSAPSSGPSGTFIGSGTFTTTAMSDANGFAASPTFTANGLAGSYIVSATVSGVITPAAFSLSNFGWYVATTGNDANDCQTPATPCATIDGPLSKSGFLADDTILIAGGTYTGTGSQVVFLNKDVRLIGAWNSAFDQQISTTIVDGEHTRKGFFVEKGATVTIDKFVVQNGSATGGGGTDLTGGGIYNGGTLTVNDSLIFGNAGMYGGGIANGAGSTEYMGAALNLNNTTVSGNVATDGGGLYNVGNLTVHNSTISDNTATFGGGGGIYNSGEFNPLLPPVILTLNNTLVSGNTATGTGPDCTGAAIISLGYNLIGNTSGCTFAASTGDLLNVNPRLFPLIGSLGVHPLLPGSPAIDAGNSAGCTDHLGHPLLADQRGVARVGRCDIGAYEYDPNNDPLTYIFLPLILK